MITKKDIQNLEAAQDTADRFGIDLYATNLRVEYDALAKNGWVPKPAKMFRTVVGLQAWMNRNAVRVVRVTAA